MTTGTASFTVTRNELITQSLRILRVLAETDVANATQIRNANTALNMLIKNMQSNGLDLWTYQQIVIPMVIGQNSYTIGPVGADVTATRLLPWATTNHRLFWNDRSNDRVTPWRGSM